ncbi:MAG: PEP-CTERM sorting domain-containing protein [Rhizobacter sp.]|nr:PEP-CTERM sorting domain-containing protein [Rhizobacter sp.]
MKFSVTAAAAALALASFGAQSAIVNIDLSAATTGSLVTGVGANFAQTFAGQSVSGIGITGTPSDPLTLMPAGDISVVSFDPGVSPESNSLLSQPDNNAPLSILLSSRADSFFWTMGYVDSPGSTIKADFFNANGALVDSRTISLIWKYSTYSLTGLNPFSGITFYDDRDPRGVRFQNMSYNTAPVPEPATYAMLLAGLGVLGMMTRRRKPG